MATLPALLAELARAGSLPASRISVSALRELRTPLAARLLEKRRQGAGERFVVLDPDGFGTWLQARFPALAGDTAASPRAANLAGARDSKRGRRGLAHCPVLARAHGDFPGQPALAALAQATRAWGGAAFLLEVTREETVLGGPSLPPGARVMTIENPETFCQSEALQGQADVFLLCGTGGRLREAFIQWLAAQETLTVLHFGDFDAVGLQEFTRLYARMPGRVALHLPEDLEACFKRYSNRALLEAPASRSVLASLPRGLSPAMDRVLDLIAIHGPLEQEAFLIQRTAGNAGELRRPAGAASGNRSSAGSRR